MNSNKLAYITISLFFIFIAGFFGIKWYGDYNNLENISLLNNKKDTNKIDSQIKNFNNIVSYLKDTVRDSSDVDSDILKQLAYEELEVNPNSFVAYRTLGNAFEIEGDLETAVEMYTKAIEINPLDYFLYDHRGDVYSALGLLSHAKKDYFSALRISPKNSDSLINLSLLYLNNGESRNIDVVEILNIAISYSDSDLITAEAFNVLGVYYLDINEPESALENFETAVSFDPNLVPAWNGIGISGYEILSSDKDLGSRDFFDLFKKTVDATDTVLSLDSNYSRVYITKGLLHKFSDDRQKEKNEYLRALKLIPSDTTLLENEKGVMKNIINTLISEL